MLSNGISDYPSDEELCDANQIIEVRHLEPKSGLELRSEWPESLDG